MKKTFKEWYLIKHDIHSSTLLDEISIAVEEYNLYNDNLAELTSLLQAYENEIVGNTINMTVHTDGSGHIMDTYNDRGLLTFRTLTQLVKMLKEELKEK